MKADLWRREPTESNGPFIRYIDRRLGALNMDETFVQKNLLVWDTSDVTRF